MVLPESQHLDLMTEIPVLVTLLPVNNWQHPDLFALRIE